MGSNSTSTTDQDPKGAMGSNDHANSDMGDNSSTNSPSGGGGASSSGRSSTSMGSGTNRTGTSHTSFSEGHNSIIILRVIIISLLMTCAAILSSVTFLLALFAEEDSFESHMVGYGEQIVEHVQDTLEKQYWAADSLAQTFSESISASASGWPNVALADFAQQCEALRQIGSADAVWIAPLLSTEQEKQDWEAFAAATLPNLSGSNYTEPYDPHLHQDLHIHPESPATASYRESFRTIPQGIYKFVQGSAVDEDASTMVLPISQVSTFSKNQDTFPILWNMYSDPHRQAALDVMLSTSSSALLSSVLPMKGEGSSGHDSFSSPTSSLYFPLLDQANSLKGMLVWDLNWMSHFQQAVHGVYEPLTAVLENSCGQQHSFQIYGSQVEYLGEGDLHDSSVRGPLSNATLGMMKEEDVQFFVVEHTDTSEMMMDMETVEFSSHSENGFVPTKTMCTYRILLYPSEDTRARFMTYRPTYMQAGVFLAFLVTVSMFIAYDCIVERRNRKARLEEARTRAIVNSLFPKNVRDRIYAEAERKAQEEDGVKKRNSVFPKQHQKARLKNYLNDDAGDRNKNNIGGAPIADLFPEATVLFSDIAGFTAWSSEREPSQVFLLLESMFGIMDLAASKLNVFKVETIGDAFVAATGLPEAQPDHAVRMARFAHTSLLQVKELVQDLQSTLGPGTEELALRFGLHSGPVTAGVLRGEKARFQLFGEVLDFAEHLESTGIPNRIHISKETAKLLQEAGKSHWTELRKGYKDPTKGETYWLTVGSKKKKPVKERSEDEDTRASSSADEYDESTAREGVAAKSINSKEQRERQTKNLIQWNVEGMLGFLTQVEAKRRAKPSQKQPSSKVKNNRLQKYASSSQPIDMTGASKSKIILDEVKELVPLPLFDPALPGMRQEDADVRLEDEVREELLDYVTQISELYVDSNPFHNFEHCSHVCLSATKLLKRIVNSDDVQRFGSAVQIAKNLHEHTFGISSDPLTQFAVVFSALIHHVGHLGVPNGQLAKEYPMMATKYRDKAIAEQNSVDVAWELLMAPCYSNLRKVIMPTKEEEQLFRQLVVNMVLATDIFDKDLSYARKLRWKKAFDEESSHDGEPEEDARNRKATIVLEHVIQASDVAHCMQHFHIYSRWNKRLFLEMYKAYREGRADKDPSIGWYNNELWFFDNYIIPLAKKLKDCGVFGVSCDEYLNYALQNRQEWERKGKGQVTFMVLEAEANERLGKDKASELVIQPRM